MNSLWASAVSPYVFQSPDNPIFAPENVSRSLIKAAESGNEAEIQWLAGFYFTFVLYPLRTAGNDDALNALALAAQNGHSDVMLVILQRYIPRDRLNHAFNVALAAAARTSRIDPVKRLLDAYPHELFDPECIVPALVDICMSNPVLFSLICINGKRDGTLPPGYQEGFRLFWVGAVAPDAWANAAIPCLFVQAAVQIDLQRELWVNAFQIVESRRDLEPIFVRGVYTMLNDVGGFCIDIEKALLQRQENAPISRKRAKSPLCTSLV